MADKSHAEKLAELERAKVVVGGCWTLLWSVICLVASVVFLIRNPIDWWTWGRFAFVGIGMLYLARAEFGRLPVSKEERQHQPKSSTRRINVRYLRWLLVIPMIVLVLAFIFVNDDSLFWWCFGCIFTFSAMLFLICPNDASDDHRSEGLIEVAETSCRDPAVKKTGPFEALKLYLALCGTVFPLVILTRSATLWLVLAGSMLLAIAAFVLHLICTECLILIRTIRLRPPQSE